MVMGLVSGLSLASHSDSESSWWYTPRSAKMDAREKDSGRWSETWCLLLTFPKFFSWWRLISSVFLTRTSCRKTTHADGYYGAWPGWAVSVSMLPLTVFLIFLKRSLVFPILLFSFISLLRQALLSLLATLWNSSFRWVYLSFSPLLLASLLFSAI